MLSNSMSRFEKRIHLPKAIEPRTLRPYSLGQVSTTNEISRGHRMGKGPPWSWHELTRPPLRGLSDLSILIGPLGLSVLTGLLFPALSSS